MLTNNDYYEQEYLVYGALLPSEIGVSTISCFLYSGIRNNPAKQY